MIRLAYISLGIVSAVFSLTILGWDGIVRNVITLAFFMEGMVR